MHWSASSPGLALTKFHARMGILLTIMYCLNMTGTLIPIPVRSYLLLRNESHGSRLRIPFHGTAL